MKSFHSTRRGCWPTAMAALLATVCFAAGAQQTTVTKSLSNIKNNAAVNPASAPTGMAPPGNTLAPPSASLNVGGIDIIVRKKPGGTPMTVRLDPTGRFNLGQLEPGDYTLTVSPDALRQLNATGQAAEIEMTGAVNMPKTNLQRAASGGIDFSLKTAGSVGGQASRAVGTKGISGN